MRHTINAAIVIVIALATRIEFLPVLAAVYVIASGSQTLSTRRRMAELRAENRDLREAPGPILDVVNPNHRRTRRSRWWLPVELVAVTWGRWVLNPLWRWVDAGDSRVSRGRHARHRWDRKLIHGTVGQRRPSAVAGQNAVAAGWRAMSTTGELPVITDQQVHLWLAEGAQSAAVADA